MKLKPVTIRGLRSIATRALKTFTPSVGNRASVHIDADNHVHLRTTASNGDNVPWAQSLYDRVAARLGVAYPQLHRNCKEETHINGNHSGTFSIVPRD